MKKFYLTAAIVYLAMQMGSASTAQTFTDINASLTPMWNASLAWGDFDNDGDLDLAIAGYVDGAGNSAMYLYRNNNGSFSNTGLTFAGFGACDLKWADLDQDGYLDIIITGNTKIGAINTPKTYIYKNNSGASFTEIRPDIVGTVSGKLSLADFDRDGDLDIAICGSDISKIYLNDGNMQFTATNLIADAISNGSIQFVDINKDGYMDVFLTGNLGGFNYIAKLYLNNRNGGLSVHLTGIVPLRYCDTRFADLNNDGYPDLITSGVWRDVNRDSVLTHVYITSQHQDSVIFTQVSHRFVGHKNPVISIGDYDNEGWLDFITVGDTLPTTAVTPRSELHHNENGYTYRDTTNPILGLRLAGVAWGDYDNDGDLDLALAGYLSSGQYRARIYRNNINRPNNLPATPTGLQAVTINDTVRLIWRAAQDNETPATALSYNLYLYNNTYQKAYVIPAADLNNGFIRRPDYGNTGQDTTMTLINLMNGQYEWTVQTVDNGWKGSSFAPKQYFTVSGSSANTPPYKIANLPDTTLNEDFGIVFIDRLNQYFADSTGTLSFSAQPQPNGLTAVIRQDSLFLQSLLNYHGLVQVMITASDGQYFVKDTFNVQILPVNDPPAPFSLLLPQNNDTLHTIVDTLLFRWRSAYDPDLNPISYTWMFSGSGLDTTVVVNDTVLIFTGCNRLQPHSQYSWSVIASDGIYQTASLDTFILFTGDLVSVDENTDNIPDRYALFANYPNPFNPTTTIRYALPQNSFVRLRIFNLLGQEVRTLIHGYQRAGYYSVVWDAKQNNGKAAAAGIYFYRLESGKFVQTKKMLLIR